MNQRALDVKRLHRAEVALRTAAVQFATLGSARDWNDRAGLRANRRLLQAARRYANAWGEEMITKEDLIAVRKVLVEYDSHTLLMPETEYVARRLGGISRPRAARLIIAARQNKTTADILRQRRKR